MFISRRFSAFASILLFLLIVYAAFNLYYGQGYESSPLMNVKLKYVVVDPTTNLTRPYFWDVDVIKGRDDKANILRGCAGGYSALEMRVYQDGEKDEHVWATIHLRQDLTGERAETLFSSKIGVWVYPTFSYLCDEKTHNPANSFGIEVKADTRLLWFIFSDKNVGVYALNNHRIVVLYTPLNEWSYKELNISAEYDKAGWSRPKTFSFMLMIGLTQAVPGTRVGFFREIRLETPQSVPSAGDAGYIRLRSFLL